VAGVEQGAEVADLVAKRQELVEDLVDRLDDHGGAGRQPAAIRNPAQGMADQSALRAAEPSSGPIT
jgi:hypothetical protein